MAWATRDDLEMIALPAKATVGIPDLVVARHLLIARRRIESMIHDAFGETPPEELIGAQCEIAAWTLITGYVGRRTDDASVQGLRDRHDQAFAWLKLSRDGMVGTSTIDDTATDEGGPEVYEGNEPRGWHDDD
jgi:hypothetical protein